MHINNCNQFSGSEEWNSGPVKKCNKLPNFKVEYMMFAFKLQNMLELKLILPMWSSYRMRTPQICSFKSKPLSVHGWYDKKLTYSDLTV